MPDQPLLDPAPNAPDLDAVDGDPPEGTQRTYEDLLAESREISDADLLPDEPAFSHLGLAQVDPWVQPRPWHALIWPWGLSGLAEVLEVVALALIMFVGVRFVAHNYVVEGGSMLPTFENGEFVIVNRLAYREFDLTWIPGVDARWRPFGHPQPGDVVVFIYQEQPRERDFIKRVVGVPGQVVEVRNATLFVDGVPLDEPYIQAAPNYEFPATAVPPGKLLVFGDNRNNSFDSHLFGLIDESQVVGRADVRYWPFARFWMVEHRLGQAAQTLARTPSVIGTVLAWR